jgi:hypothetical protein
LEEYRYREAMFPTGRSRGASDVVKGRRGAQAVREYLEVLLLAAREGEGGVDDILRLLLNAGRRR